MESEKPVTMEKETKQWPWSEKLMYNSPRAIGFAKTSGTKKESEVLDQTKKESKIEDAKVMEKIKIPEKVKENKKELDQSDQKPEEHHEVPVSDLNKQLQNLELKLQENEENFKKAQQDLEEKMNFLEQDRSCILSDLYESIKETEYYKRVMMQKTKELVDRTADFQHFYFHLGPHYEQCIDWMTRRINEFKAHIDAELSSGARAHRLEAVISGLEKEVGDLRDKLRSVSSTFATASEDHFDEYEFVE